MTLPNKDNYDKLIEMHSRVKTLFDAYYAAKKIEDEIVAEDQVSGHATLYKHEQAQAMHALDQAIVDLVTNMPVLEEEPQFGLDTDPNSPPLEWVELHKGTTAQLFTLCSGGGGNLPPEQTHPPQCGNNGRIADTVWPPVEVFADVQHGGAGHFGGIGGVGTTTPPGATATADEDGVVLGFQEIYDTIAYAASGLSNSGITRTNPPVGNETKPEQPNVKTDMSHPIRPKSWGQLMLIKLSKLRKHISR